MRQPITAAPCKYCHVVILWSRTAAGANIPLDQGPLTIIDNHGVTHTGRQSHWASCPCRNQARQDAPQNQHFREAAALQRRTEPQPELPFATPAPSNVYPIRPRKLRAT